MLGGTELNNVTQEFKDCLFKQIASPQVRENLLRKFYRRHTKNDSLDAKTLAKMPIVDSDSLQEVYIRQKNMLALNTRCKQRARLVKNATAKRNSIK